jgi:hypothetical protein
MIDTDTTLLPPCIKMDLARNLRPCLTSDSRQGWVYQCTFCPTPPNSGFAHPRIMPIHMYAPSLTRSLTLRAPTIHPLIGSVHARTRARTYTHTHTHTHTNASLVLLPPVLLLPDQGVPLGRPSTRASARPLWHTHGGKADG